MINSGTFLGEFNVVMQNRKHRGETKTAKAKSRKPRSSFFSKLKKLF